MSSGAPNSRWRLPSRDRLDELKGLIEPKRDDAPEDVLVQDDMGNLWFLNTVGDVDELRPPRAYYLSLVGRSLVNVAEVRLLTPEGATTLQEVGLRRATERCFLVRVAEDYSSEELPCRSLDAAVAGELVFSVWTRRRDAHEGNRGYNCDGIPSFFDFDVAFCKDGRSRDIADFFSHAGLGDAGSWRVRECTTGMLPLTTRSVRALGKDKGQHLVTSFASFEGSARSIAKAIASYEQDLREIATLARVEPKEGGRLADFLEKGKRAIEDETEKMLEDVARS